MLRCLLFHTSAREQQPGRGSAAYARRAAVSALPRRRDHCARWPGGSAQKEPWPARPSHSLGRTSRRCVPDRVCDRVGEASANGGPTVRLAQGDRRYDANRRPHTPGESPKWRTGYAKVRMTSHTPRRGNSPTYLFVSGQIGRQKGSVRRHQSRLPVPSSAHLARCTVDFLTDSVHLSLRCVVAVSLHQACKQILEQVASPLARSQLAVSSSRPVSDCSGSPVSSRDAPDARPRMGWVLRLRPRWDVALDGRLPESVCDALSARRQKGLRCHSQIMCKTTCIQCIAH